MGIKPMTDVFDFTQADRIEIKVTGAFDENELEEDLEMRCLEFDYLDGSDRTKHVYACYGLAMYQAQCLEVGLQSLVRGYHALTGIVTAANVNTYEQEFARKTLGQLFATLRKHVHFDEE